MLKKDFGVKRYTIISMGLILCITLTIIGRVGFAQTPPAQTPAAGQPAQAQPVGPSEASISTTYREPKKDPFFDESKIKKEAKEEKKIRPVEAVPWPSYEEREAIWKQRRDEARRSGQPEPSPSEKYLIDELAILGIYKKPEGQGLFLKPKTAANTMIFAAVGQKFWNGSIRRIDGTQVDVEELTKLSNNTTKSENRTLRFTRGK